MGEQVRVSPKCGEKLKWGFESPTAPKKKLKKVLTNRKVCDIIKIQMRDARQKPARWQDPRESDKPLTIKSSTARSPRGCGI